MDIDTRIEILRALHGLCPNDFNENLLEYDNNFYEKLFGLYDLDFNFDTVKQKREFLTKATEQYILTQLPQAVIRKEHNRYIPEPVFKEPLCEHMNVLVKLVDSCNNSETFETEFAKQFHTRKKSLKKYRTKNRNNNLSNFAKAVVQIYEYKDNKKED